MTTNTKKTGARCCGTRVTVDGTFYCDRKPVAAYTWDGVPFNYNGKPGAAACDEHQTWIFANGGYPGLKLIEVLKKPRTMADLKRDPRVTDISDERGSEDGIWAYLVAGFCWAPETHAVHEDTLAEVFRELASVKPCACADCVREASTGEGLPLFARELRKLQGVR